MRSMTGFGQAVWEGDGVRVSVEVRGVNHRFLDVKLALPRDSQAWEPELRRLVTDIVERGKVDVSVNRAGAGSGARGVEVDHQLAAAVVDGWRALQKKLGLQGEVDLGFLLQSRGEFVRVVESRGEVADDLPRVRTLLEKALRAFDAARRKEGVALQKDMKARQANLVAIEKQLAARSREIVPQMAERLAARLGKLLDGRPIEESRLLQEAAVLAERSDVHEELVRLSSHLGRLAGLLRQKGSIGKAIDFLLQEIHRELNTIASKSSDVEVTRLTLEGRGEVEKLREQVQNVE